MGIEKKRKMYKAVSRNHPPPPPAKGQVATGSSVGLDGLGVPWVTRGFPFLKILFIHERHREKGRHRQMEKQAPHRKPDVGLNPRTPEPKAGAQLLSHPGAPKQDILNKWQAEREFACAHVPIDIYTAEMGNFGNVMREIKFLKEGRKVRIMPGGPTSP